MSGIVPYFSDHKAHLKSFTYLKNQKYALSCSAPKVWIWLCFLISSNQIYVINGTIYLVASYS